MDDHFPNGVLLTNFGEVEFAFLFEVEKCHENKEDNCDDENNDGVNNWKRSKERGERREWDLEFGDPAVGDVELGVRFSRCFDYLPMDAIVMIGVVNS